MPKLTTRPSVAQILTATFCAIIVGRSWTPWCRVIIPLIAVFTVMAIALDATAWWAVASLVASLAGKAVFSKFRGTPR